jgi:receptor protein-tyrosine kinase
LVLPIALAGGLLVGSAAAFALGTLDPKVRSREDLERATGLRVLARVPSGAPDARLTPQAPQGAGGKAFQSLLDEIGAAYGSARPQSIGIASVDADGGSAQAAFNLALAAAESGHRVLLIDAGVEQRQLTQRLAFDGQAGLGTCAANGAELASVVIPVPGTAIDFVAADPQAAAEIRRVGARSLPQLAREAGTPYGLVVLDLGCVSREPIARTAASAEATVLLVGLDHSALEATKAAVAALRSGTARLVGLALTSGRMRAG